MLFDFLQGFMNTRADSSAGLRQSDRIPADLLAKIDEATTRYPVSKRSASLPLLHLWQNHFGFIDESGVNWIAKRLDLEPINILELVTFYPWFRQQAPGKHIIRVCRTLSCAMAGSYELREKFCKATGVDPGADHHHGLPTSPDGKYSVEFVECLASCGSAPVCLINDELHEDVTANDIPKILNQHV